LRALLVGVPTDPGPPGDPQQPGHPLATDPQTHPEPELGMGSWGSVGASRHRVDVHDRVAQIGVLKIAVGQVSIVPLVVARSGDPEHPAGHRDIDPVVGKLADQPEHYFGRTFSLAK
jgi:hypothetical protein